MFLCVASVNSDFCGLACIYVRCVCTCCRSERAGLQLCCVHTLFNVQKMDPFIGKISTKILYVKHLHTFNRYCSDYYRCVYIFSAMCKVLYRSWTFFRMGQNIFLCYCKKILIFVLHVTTILYTQFLFSAKKTN